MRLEALLNSVNAYRKPLPGRRSQHYFGEGGYDADPQDSRQVGLLRIDEIHGLTAFRIPRFDCA